MKIVSTMALALALATGSAVALAPPAFAKKKEEEAKGPNLSKEARAPLAAAQTALAANDFATTAAKLAEAQAASKTADDTYYVGAIKYELAVKQNDEAGKNAAIDAMLQSGVPTGDRAGALYAAQGQAAYLAKDYQKAQTALAKSVELKPAADVLLMLADISARMKQFPQALGYADRAIEAQKTAGQPVSEDWYRRRLSIAYDAKMSPEAIRYSSEIVQAYPTPENWRNALVIYRDSAKLDPQTDLDVLRLQRATKSLVGESDYYEYASSANDRGLPGEALAVLDLGAQNNQLAPAKAKPLRDEITGRVADDKKSLPASATKAKAAADGRPAMNTADAYLGYGDYAKAAELYQAALQKGGVDANTVNTRLGIALAMQGQKDAAKTAFAAVTGPRQQVASFWTIWLNQPTA